MLEDCKQNSMPIDGLKDISRCVDDVLCASKSSAFEINLLACALADAICKDKTSEHLKFVVEFLQVLIGLIKTYR